MNKLKDYEELNLLCDKEKLKSFGFEINKDVATLQYNLFFNSIFTQICVNFSKKTTQINILESETGDLYLPFYSDFYGAINPVLDSVKNAYFRLIDELEISGLLIKKESENA